MSRVGTSISMGTGGIFVPLSAGQKRIFTLEPSKIGGIITGTLEVVPLMSDEPYEALSYCVGDPKPVAEISCNGELLPVAANLNAALYRIRDGSVSRRIWIDAICIAQGNLQEKSAQVAEMKTIYRLAELTIVYLGEHDEGSTLALSVVSMLAQAYNSWNHESLEEYLKYPDMFTANYALPDLGTPAWKYLFALLDRPYFHRTWVVQEVCLQSRVTVLCGHSSLQWEDFYLADLALTLLIMKPAFFRDLGPRGASITRIGGNRAQIQKTARTSLTNFVHLLTDRNLESTERVDRVFAMLGLIDVDPSAGCLPDYEMSWDKVRTGFMTKLMKHLLVREQRLDALNHHLLPNHPQDLPSWVPDITAPPSDWPLHSLPGLCAGGQRAEIRVDGLAQNSIAVMGFIVDDIEPSDVSFKSDKGNLDVRAQLLNKIRHEAQGGGASSEVSNIYARAVLAKATTGHERIDINHFSTLWAAPFPRDDRHAVSWDGPNQSSAQNQMDAYLHASYVKYGRRSMRTFKSRLGAFPLSAVAGDIICILLGACTPYVMRSCDGAFQVVGQCYVDGLMYGEWLQGNSAEAREFVLI